MEVSYAPRSQVAAWLRKGWRLDASHEYDPDDYAVVMVLPDVPAELSEAEIDAIAGRFKRPFTPIEIRSNLSRASSGRNAGRNRYLSRRIVQEMA